MFLTAFTFLTVAWVVVACAGLFALLSLLPPWRPGSLYNFCPGTFIIIFITILGML